MRQPCLGICWAERAILFIDLHWDWVSHPPAQRAFSVPLTLGPQAKGCCEWVQGAEEEAGGPEQAGPSKRSRSQGWTVSPKCLSTYPRRHTDTAHETRFTSVIYSVTNNRNTQSHPRHTVTAQRAHRQPHPTRPHISHTGHTQPPIAIHKSCLLHSQTHSYESGPI